MSALPDPLVPPDVDLRGYEFMPLFGDRLFGSETWIGATPEAKLAGLQLWWRAYAKEVPSSSLPDNDTLLASYAGYGIAFKQWRKIKAQAMRGFVLCADGRWYHPFVAELAMDAWKGRCAHQLRTLKARIANTERRLNAAVTDDDKAHIGRQLQDLRQALSQALVEPCYTPPKERRGEERTGIGQDKENLEELTPLSGKPDGEPPEKKINGSAYYPEAEDVLAYLNKSTGKGFEFRSRSGSLTTNADRIIARLKQGYTREELREVVHAKCAQWLHDDRMAEFLRPATLFAKENFEQYVGELRNG